MDSVQSPLVHSNSPRGLTREQAAVHCGFVVATFDAWVRRGLLPRPSTDEGRWHPEELSAALERAVRDGHLDTISKFGAKPKYAPLPNVHRTCRLQADDTKKNHYYRRGLPGRLLGEPGSPQFMAALIAKERQLATEVYKTSSPEDLPRCADGHEIVPSQLPLPEHVQSDDVKKRAPVAHTAQLRPSDLAARFGLTARYWRAMAAAGRIPGARQPSGRRGGWIFDRSAFEAWWSKLPKREGRPWQEYTGAGRSIGAFSNVSDDATGEASRRRIEQLLTAVLGTGLTRSKVPRSATSRAGRSWKPPRSSS